jgi:hypothetical protein
VLAVCLLLVGACGSDEDATIDESTVEEAAPIETDVVEEEAPVEQDDPPIDDELADDEFADDELADEEFVDDEQLPVDDVDCSEEALTGGDDEFVFTSAYVVVDGELGELCFGADDDTILDAWDSLATITPPGQLADLVLFGGFEPDGDGAAETLAFVNAVDSDGSGFQMSINTVDALADPDELLLTLAHEFSHVFTATPGQLDRTDEGIDACATYFNGEGCYLEESLMWAWIGAFWAPDVLASVDPNEESVEDADARCGEDDGFFGPYAATNPEEDFAEAFSAFVFDLAPQTDGQAARLDWIAAQPGLAAFRDRAVAAGSTPLANNFEVCGF